MATVNIDNPACTENNISSSCFRCGECCTRYQALVEEAEIQRIADYLGISTKKFKIEYTDPRWPIQGKFLLSHRDNIGCIFLIQHDKEFLCSIHAVKPHPCQDWTAALSRKECRHGLSKVWNLTISDTGEICGTEHDKEAFTKHITSISA
ncbi:MAG: YkgJ family cysteine cluster protein [Dehalococcoidia bacterium]|jgi:Fe-S-cluster containining protein|nr:YkgJ family cysteine cluster protein [Dehalococcoidia bacterium]